MIIYFTYCSPKGKPDREWETSFKEESISESELQDTNRSKKIKIKRPLGTVIFSPTKRILHSRRQSSGSDLTLPSWNGKYFYQFVTHAKMQVKLYQSLVY